MSELKGKYASVDIPSEAGVEELRAEIARLQDKIKRLQDGSAQLTIMFDTQLKKAEARVKELEDQLDLNRDEFLRIRACPAANLEIKQLCDRSQTTITQNVHVLTQRDNAERACAVKVIEVIALKARAKELEAREAVQRPVVEAAKKHAPILEHLLLESEPMCECDVSVGMAPCPDCALRQAARAIVKAVRVMEEIT